MNLEDAITRVIEGLSEIGVEYMLIGSFSSMYYSFPRSTTDADFVVGRQDLGVVRLSTILGERFKFDPQLSFETVGRSSKNEIEIKGTPFRIEIFRLTNEPFDQSRFERRREIVLFGKQVWIPTVEDVIIQKLIWDRPKDRDDVAGVIEATRKSLDEDYLQSWASRLSLTDALLRASAPHDDSAG
ncbi:hypothetical protein [Neorhodopirellula pilleata]|uniref:Nucleotidyltransferase n=1 Tax=Neorhodopirellula pilleata TaxID=2714738 RepID=A0A5C6AG05_9BACT|nr:hypothetical protein [Neorhodopirellula pilleata]TWT97143.1 hypothetical protein Pla100_22920 [Neorhodopirellula pilleata]